MDQLQYKGLETKVNWDFINTLLMVLQLCCSYLYQVSRQMLDRYAMPRVYDQHQMMACRKGQDQRCMPIIKKFHAYLLVIMFKSILGNIWASKRKPPSILPWAVTLIILGLIYTKPHKFASGNKMGESCSRVKIVQSIFARMKGRVLRPV